MQCGKDKLEICDLKLLQTYSINTNILKKFCSTITLMPEYQSRQKKERTHKGIIRWTLSSSWK